VFPLGREALEGVPYNIAWSNYIGERGLIGISLIAQQILRREQINLGWLQSKGFHKLALLTSVQQEFTGMFLM